MEISISETSDIQLRKVFLPLQLVSDKGEKIIILMRDSGFEFYYEGNRYEAKGGIIKLYNEK